MPTWVVRQMKKRKRGEEVNEEGEHGDSGNRKKARVEEDALGKFLSLLEAGNTLAGKAIGSSNVRVYSVLCIEI